MKEYGFVTYEEQTYKTVIIGTQTWMAENLNYGDFFGKCYGTVNTINVANCDMYGGLYNWATAMALPDSCNSTSCITQINTKHKGICPTGWHIPSDAEWGTLIQYIDPSCPITDKCYGPNPTISGQACVCYDGINNTSNLLKATSGGYDISYNGTDDYGFTALPSGYGEMSPQFPPVRYNGIKESSYWWTPGEMDASNAYNRIINLNGILFGFQNKKSNLLSVRCLKD